MRWRIGIPLGVLLMVGTGLIAQDQYGPGELIIKFSPDLRSRIEVEGAATGIPEVDLLSQRYGIFEIERLIRDPNPLESACSLGLDLLYLFRGPKDLEIFELVKEYEALPQVEYALPNYWIPLLSTPNDPRFGLQWHLKKIDAPGAWGATHGDTAVVVAVVDSDCDWRHEDIEKNLWINRGEDINRDGRFTSADINGVDDDHNGYMDDLIGWNFYKNTNDPSPDPAHQDKFAYGHGTMCFGIATAVTNNAKGVAGVGWNCRGMAFSCVTPDGNHIDLSAAIAAIYYAVRHGASVISMSWGGFSVYPPLRAALQFAHGQGLVLVGAAGNDNLESPKYPANYEGVIAVAASNRADYRSSYSNYGTWIDVCAPGDAILTTYPNNEYYSALGTSMSTPIVAGLAALIKAAHPDWSNTQIEDCIFNTCDPMPDPLYAQGKLGHGRVNAFKAVALTSRCNLVAKTRLDDSRGNNNGRADLGEEVMLWVTLTNSPKWQDAKGVSARITTGDKGIELIEPSTTFPDIPAGSSKECRKPFRFRVKGGFPRRALLLLELSSTPPPYKRVDTLLIPVGEPRILLVDDDGNQDYEKFYQLAFDSTDYVLYQDWEVATLGSPSAANLKAYRVVCWLTGTEEQTLSGPERSAIAEYLGAGGGLFISSQNLGEELGTTPFYSEWFCARFSEPDVDIPLIIGTPGDPIGQGDTCLLGAIGGAQNAKSCDGIEPIDGATTIFTYRGSPLSAAVKYENGYRLVYFAFPFEAVSGPEKYTQKPALMQRILEWFGGVFGVEEPETSSTLPFKWLKLDCQPNPFQCMTTIQFQLSSSQRVSLRVYDVLGRFIKTLGDLELKAGTHTLSWDGRDAQGEEVPGGVYFLHLETPEERAIEKVIYLR